MASVVSSHYLPSDILYADEHHPSSSVSGSESVSDDELPLPSALMTPVNKNPIITPTVSQSLASACQGWLCIM